MRTSREAFAVSRARASGGTSAEVLYRMVARLVDRRGRRGNKLVDVGCGRGELRSYVVPYIGEYIGADIVRYEGFPGDATFVETDLDSGRISLPDHSVDIVAAIETIEHLENPRAFMRELRRIGRPGGLVIVTTPNQLSLLSKLTLLLKNRFNAFQEGSYPAHITALLEIDLIRIATECGFREIEIDYTNSGRIPFTPRHWPAAWMFAGRSFSDNMALSAIIP